MGAKLVKAFEIANQAGGMQIEMRLAMKSGMSKQKASGAPDSPENILGTRWLGISYPGYGIHGTTIPESLGSQSTSGCIRMLNEEVEELYSIVPYGTEVEIKD